MFVGFVLMAAAGCKRSAGTGDHPSPSSTPSRAASASVRCPPPPRYEPSPIEREEDIVFSLLADAIDVSDWQTASDRTRGANVAAVLVSPELVPVCWARNTTDIAKDATRHAEVVAITNYLRNARSYDLKGYSIYVTLEPCPMCAGMILVTHVHKVIFSTRQHSWVGHTFDRLQAAALGEHGACPHYWGTVVGVGPADISDSLDSASSRPDTYYFLETAAAKGIFEKAERELRAFQATGAESARVLRHALDFLDKVPRGPGADPYETECPPTDLEQPSSPATTGE